MIHNDIEMRIAFDSPPESGAGDALLVTGAVQITINGKTLTALETSSNTNEESYSKMFDHSGEEIQIEDLLFQGHYVGPFLVSFVESLLEIAQKDTKRFQERYVDLEQDSGDRVLVLSYLDGKSIRIAIQNRYGRNEHRNPTVEQLVGYAVDFEALTRETIRCGRTFLDYAETAGCRDTSMAKDLAESVGRLELVLRDNEA